MFREANQYRAVRAWFSKVRPRLEADFTTADKLGIYLQVYNLTPTKNPTSPMPLSNTPSKKAKIR